MINSCSHRLPATFVRFKSKFLHDRRHTFFRSYGINLQSSLTRVLSSALGFSPHPPVLDYGTVFNRLKLSGFSWKRGIVYFASKLARHHISVLTLRTYLEDPPTCLNRDNQTPGHTSLLRPRIASVESAGILTCFPSTTPFGLALGVD